MRFDLTFSSVQVRSALLIAAIGALSLAPLLASPEIFRRPDGTQCSAATEPSCQETSVWSSRNAKDLLVREHTIAASEIQKRIEHEYEIYVLKIMLVGAIIGFAFNAARRDEPQDRGSLDTSPLACACAWAAVALAALLDLRSQYNVWGMLVLGEWICNCLELPAGLVAHGWESYIASNRADIELPGIERYLLTLMLYWATIGVFVARSKARESTLQMSWFGAPLAMLLIGLSRMYKAPDETGWWLAGAITAPIVIVLVGLAMLQCELCRKRQSLEN